MSTLARWCFQHRYLVIGGWLALIVALFGSTLAAGTSYNDAFGLPDTESSKALTLLQQTLPAQAGDADQIVVHVDSGTVRDPAVHQRIAGMLGSVQHLPAVTGVTSMYEPAAVGQISADGRTAYATVTFDAQADSLADGDVQKVIDTARAARGNGLQVELAGQAIGNLSMAAPASTELIGIAAAAVILFLTFGSLLAMVLPPLVAVAGLGAGLLTVGLLSHAITLSSFAPTLAALIGLGVGIDYALFIITRHRTGLRDGLTPEQAALRALNTSGRAVLFAGGTVVVALLGLLVLRVSFLTGLGIGGAVTVLFTVAAALTLLPALLGVVGGRLLPRRQRRALAARAAAPTPPAAPTGLWARWAALVAHRKAVLSLVTLAVIAVVAVPTLSLRLGSSDDGNGPTSSTTRQAYDLLATGFGPGSNGPLELVAQLRAPGDTAALTALVGELRSTPGVASVTAAPVPRGAAVGIVEVVPTSAPQDQATSDLITRLRDEVIPAAERGTSLAVYVGGNTATFGDFASVLTSKLPLFLAVIITLGCLLLLLAFRSIVIPLTAAVMNLLAAGAAFGVVVAVFQWGWGASLLSIGKQGPVEAFLPVIMLAILFGLSMDYQVFLVSRMKEEWQHTHDNTRAVTIGQAETGRVITAAALIMISVFGAFVFGGDRITAEFGVGLAAAVALDAFLLRTVLVPALMHLVGSANWWLPTWVDRALPQISVEGAADSAPRPQPRQPAVAIPDSAR
jgi:RND superfamily putative drug exporter